MPAGLTVINDNGKYQIDELTYSLAVMATGTYNSLTLGTIQTTVPNPMFAVYIPQDSNFIGGIGNVSLSGGTWSAQIVLFSTPGATTSTTNIKWFVLGRPSVTSSGAGMEVYDTSGNLKHSTLVKTKTIAGEAGGVINTAKKYAVLGGLIRIRTVVDVQLLTNMTWQTYTAYFGNGYYSSGGGVFGNEIIYQETIETGAGGSSYETVEGNDSPALCIDVTEYI